MSLVRPHLKMSKSHADPKSRITITDSREEIHKKVKSALTDSVPGISYDPVERPGVSNLIDILCHLQDDEQQVSPQEIARDCDGLSMRSFKERVADCVDRHLASIRDAYFALTAGSERGRLEEALALGNLKASQSASRTMEIVRHALGL